MEPPRFFFWLNTASSESKLEQSWQMWTWYHCSGNLASFFGSAMKPCGPCFMSQSTTKWLVACALSSGQHSEEPRVVVTNGNTDCTKFDGAQSMVLGCVFLVHDYLRLFGETRLQPGVLSIHAEKGAGHPNGAVPWCHLTPNHTETIVTVAVTCPCHCCFKAVNVPWSCRPLVLHDWHTIDMQAPALQACPTTCMSLRRPSRDCIPAFKVGC